MSAAVLTRFAPSPTGLLHLGNARVALVNWLYARSRGGRMLLRHDDTDAGRSEARYIAAIEEDLAWLGLGWDAVARQSERLDRYAAAFERLRADGRVYPCYETPEELAAKRRDAQARGRPPVYDRASLRLDEGDRARLESQGRRPHWRFRLDAAEIGWRDLLRGPQRFRLRSFSDPVVFRADGRPTYTLASVVDDVELGVTHVIRGEDHVANTAVQLALVAALGRAPEEIAFGHLPLLLDAEGRNLSKREGSQALAALRERGIEALAVTSLLARLGTADPVVPVTRIDDLVAGFDLGRFGRAAPHFDPAELDRLNAKLLHALPFEAVADRLAEIGIEGADARFWEVVRGNLETLADARLWWRVCRGEIAPVIEDPAFTARAAELLPDEPWDTATWSAWTRAVGQATERRGRALYRPLRLALTGREDGPELKNLLPMIGRARALARLGGRVAR